MRKGIGGELARYRLRKRFGLPGSVAGSRPRGWKVQELLRRGKGWDETSNDRWRTIASGGEASMRGIFSSLARGPHAYRLLNPSGKVAARKSGTVQKA
jgi:hypothetical protein